MNHKTRLGRLEARDAMRDRIAPKAVEEMSDAELLDLINRCRLASGLSPFVGALTDAELDAEIERLRARESGE